MVHNGALRGRVLFNEKLKTVEWTTRSFRLRMKTPSLLCHKHTSDLRGLEQEMEEAEQHYSRNGDRDNTSQSQSTRLPASLL